MGKFFLRPKDMHIHFVTLGFMLFKRKMLLVYLTMIEFITISFLIADIRPGYRPF